MLEAAKLEGIYVPSFYEPEYREDGTIKSITIKNDAPQVVRKRIVQDLDKAYFPINTIVPSTEIVHDRTNVELFRGCIRGCRFCQAGFCYRPVRAKSVEVLCQQATALWRIPETMKSRSLAFPLLITLIWRNLLTECWSIAWTGR